MAWEGTPIEVGSGTTYYCDADDVAAYLGIDAFTGNDETRVNALINYAEGELEARTGHAWREITVTNEVHSLTTPYKVNRGRDLNLDHRSITELTTLEKWIVDSWVEWGTEGSDWTVEYSLGKVYMKGFWWRETQVLRWRVSYKYGEASVPSWVKLCTVLLTCASLLIDEGQWNKLPTSGDEVDIRRRISIWNKQINRLIRENAEILLFGD